MSHAVTDVDTRGGPAKSHGVLDLSSTRRVSFLRLVRVELRKMADTRAGLWMLIAVLVLTSRTGSGRTTISRPAR